MDLVGVTERDVLSEYDVAAAAAEEPSVHRPPEHQAERAGHGLRDEQDEFVLQQRGQSGAPDDERAILRAGATGLAEELILRALVRGGVSDPALFTVPLQGARDPVAKGHDRFEGQFAARPTDIERPTFRKEVYTASVERRRQAERGAHGFAGRPRQPDRPDGEPQPARRHLRNLGRELDDLAKQRDFRAGDDIGPAGRRRHSRAQPQSLADVVDMREVVGDQAVPEQDESTLGDLAEELEEPPVAGAVDTGWPCDDQVDAEARGGLSTEVLALQFRFLIHVAGLERRVLVGRRSLDVPVNAYRAAMNDAPRAISRSRFDDRRDPGGVEQSIRRSWQARSTVQGGNVVDHVDVLGSPAEAGEVSQVTWQHLHAERGQVRGAGGIPCDDPDGITARVQPPRQMPSGEASGARDKRSHRSATIVTGDPSNRRKPSTPSPLSRAVVTRIEPTALCRVMGSTN